MHCQRHTYIINERIKKHKIKIHPASLVTPVKIFDMLRAKNNLKTNKPFNLVQYIPLLVEENYFWYIAQTQN